MQPGFQPLHPDGILCRTRDGRNIVLREALIFCRKDGTILIAPDGTESDGASVPTAAQPLISPQRIFLPGVLHDAGYRDKLLNGQWSPVHLSRSQCDDLILEAMESIGIDLVTRETVYLALRAAGNWAFDADRDANEKAALVSTWQRMQAWENDPEAQARFQIELKAMNERLDAL